MQSQRLPVIRSCKSEEERAPRCGFTGSRGRQVGPTTIQASWSDLPLSS